MVEEAKEIENSESPAVRLVRLSYIEDWISSQYHDW